MSFIAETSKRVVLADFIFTAVAVVVQPITGAVLVILVGYSWTELWIWLSLALYVFVGLCWLPVVWLQMEMGKMAEAAQVSRSELPQTYHRYFRIWFTLGWPAFLSVLVIMALMITRPV